jgi:thiol:disulfide interchange protein DsbC
MHTTDRPARPAARHARPHRGAARTALLVGLIFGSVLGMDSAHADEAAVRQGLRTLVPELPAIDEVRRTPVAGLYEVRIGHRVFYADEGGRHVVQGSIHDNRTRTDLTRQRIEQLTAFNFKALPFKDALVSRQGAGRRQVAVFSDPLCGHCKRLEAELKQVDDLTVHVFAVPMLGEQALARARDIWCADQPLQRWHAWMRDAVAPPPAPAQCDGSALLRNLSLADAHHVEGTPTLVFEDGTRASGVLSSAALTQRLARTVAAR